MKFRFVTTVHSDIADSDILVWESVVPVGQFVTPQEPDAGPVPHHLQVRIFKTQFWSSTPPTMCFTAVAPCSKRFAGASAKSQD